ncbi:MAG: Uma2 family endonuclease [Chloroflexi bacterium]|nr:Uma2 family endonuclease [Chloroflexota bacterium]
MRTVAIELARKLWTIEEYEEIIEKGILDKYDHVELIRGEIVNMAPIGMRHVVCVARLDSLFHKLPEREVAIFVQSPIQLQNNSMPEPDVALLRGPLGAFAHRRAIAQDVILLVEVADSTLATDRSVKVPLYAEAVVTEVWIVNLDEEVIEVYSEPEGGKYGSVRRLGRGEEVALPAELEGSVRVEEVLGEG